MILSIETATPVCSVALFDGSNVVGLLESVEVNAHSRILHVLIDKLLKESGTDVNSLDAVAVSKGPGSYTGLRIGVSAAKGICYAKDIPLISVNTLKGMAFGMRSLLDSYDQKTLLVPMIDARRMEVYNAVYNIALETVRETSAEVITEDSFSEFIQKGYKLILAGDGTEKCRSILKHDNFNIIVEFAASAKYMIEPVNKAFNEKKFEDVAYFEPFYLKDFIAGKPKVKGL